MRYSRPSLLRPTHFAKKFRELIVEALPGRALCRLGNSISFALNRCKLKNW